MAKFKKIFLNTAMLCGICCLGGGLTTYAEDTPTEPTLTENFSFVEEFDYGDGSIDAYGGANNHNIYANNKQELVTPTLDKKDDLEVLKVTTVKNTSQTGKISFRDNASASSLFNKENGSMVLKFNFNIDHGREQQFGLWFHANDIGASRTYTLLRMRDDGTYFQLPGGAWTKVDTLSGRVTKNEWHEATFILENNGALDGTKSQDKIIGFLDGKFLYETTFADNDDFNGKLTEFFYNMPESDTSADINMWLDYIRIGEYNAPVAAAPVLTSVKTSVPFKLDPVIKGTDETYAPSVNPNFSVEFSIGDEKLTETTENGITTYSLNDTAILNYENGSFSGLSAVENVKAVITFDGNMLSPLSVTFTIEQNVEPIPVTDITAEKIVMDDTITLGIGEQFELNGLFRAYPSSADNTGLSYELLEDNGVLNSTDLVDGILTAASAGQTKIKVSAVDESGVTKEITVKVTKGAFAELNNFELTDEWAEAEVTNHGFLSKAYSKEFSPVTVVEDDLFGKALMFTGKGGANASGSHLDKHIGISSLSENKDYKLTGWIKMNEGAASVASSARIDLKLFTYYMGANGQLSYGSAAPYSFALQNDKSKLVDGWYYFETGTVNLDANAIGNGFAGIKIEIGTWNTAAGIDSYITHLKLVEQDTVHTESWNLVNDANQALNITNPMDVQANAEYQLNVVAVPSSGTISAEFTSSDTTIATVAANGLVTFLDKVGEVSITVKVGNEEKVVTFNVSKAAQEIEAPETIDIILSTFDPRRASYNLTVTPADSTSEFEVVVADETVCKATIISGKLWITEPAFGTTTITITAKDNPEATVTITVTVKDYTVTYNVQGHGTAPEALVNVTALPVTLPNDLTAEGYVFGGWFTNEACTEAAVAGTAITADTTLYAKWTQVFTVSFNLLGHGEAIEALVNVTALPTELPQPTAEGYVFVAWYTNEACTEAAVAGTAITANTTLYAKWVEKAADSFTVTYNVQGHGTAPATVVNVTALPETLPNNLTAEGYVFGGWFTDAACTKAAVAGTAITADIVLYAKWTQVFTVTYDVQGHGTAPEALVNVTALPATLPNDLTAEGYTFGGWFTDAACTEAAVAGTAITANTTLYAKWTENTPEPEQKYTITYNIQGHGTQPAAVENVTALPSTLPVLTASGWKFEGWFTDAACKEAAVAGSEITANTTLYAKWTEVSAPVTPEQPQTGLGAGAIAGIVIGVTTAVAAAGVATYFVLKKKKESNGATEVENQDKE